MTIILFLIVLYITGIVGRFYILAIYKSEAEVNFFEHRTDLIKYLLLPAYFLFFISKSRKNIDHKFKKELHYIYIIAELLCIFSSLLLFSNSDYFNLLFQNSAPDFFVLILFSVVLYFALLYLSLFDIITFSIPEIFTKRLLFFVLLANILIAIARLMSSIFFKKEIFQFVSLGRIDNLVAGILIGFVIWLIIKITKQTGMGEGDIEVMAIVGFTLGFPSILYSFYYTLIIGSIISLIYALIVKRYKNVQIPFVPFIFLGFLAAMMLGDKFILLIR